MRNIAGGDDQLCGRWLPPGRPDLPSQPHYTSRYVQHEHTTIFVLHKQGFNDCQKLQQISNKLACSKGVHSKYKPKPPLKLLSVCLLCLTDITPLNGPAAAKGPSGGGSFKVLETEAFDRSIVCHKSMFPYAVFKCHNVSAEGTIKTYAVAMESQTDGSHMHQLASCRMNKDSEVDAMTRKFGPDSNYNNAGACHWITDAFVWVPATTAR